MPAESQQKTTVSYSDLDGSPAHYAALRLADIAQQLELHESTVSRAVREKYLQCSRGVYPFSYFFSRTASASGEAIYPAGKGPQAKPRHSENGIIVEDLDNCMVKFSKCCTPVPGDPVVGFITKGYGVSIHRQDCPNADPARRKPEEAGRWVKVAWADAGDATFRTSLEISAKDRDGLTLDVAMALSAQKAKLSNISARSQPDGYAMINLELSVKDKGELTSLVNKLSTVPGVFLVRRAGG